MVTGSGQDDKFISFPSLIWGQNLSEVDFSQEITEDVANYIKANMICNHTCYLLTTKSEEPCLLSFKPLKKIFLKIEIIL